MTFVLRTLTIYSISYWMIGEPPLGLDLFHANVAKLAPQPVTIGFPGEPRN